MLETTRLYMNFASLLNRELSKMVSIKNNSGNTMNLSSENSITPSSKRGWESMRVGRREFAWVFPQLSLVGETSSESWMRVDENLFSLSDYLVFSRCLHVSFSSLFDACQTVDSPSHYSNCHLSMIRNNIFFFLWLMTWKSLASATLYTTLVQLSSSVKRTKPLIDSHQNLNQL